MDITGSDSSPVAAGRGWVVGQVLAGLIPFGLVLLLAVLCYVCVGGTLGLYLGGLAVVGLIVPPVLLGQRTLLEGVVAGGGMIVAIAIVWVIPVFQSVMAISEWLSGCVVLVSYAISLLGLAFLLRRVLGSAVVASALTVILGVSWLTWPIWLAPGLTGAGRERIVADLVYAHPLFGLSGSMRPAFQVPWAQYRIAYLLTNIGDDIPYELPATIIPCLLLHFSTGGVLLFASRVRRRRPS
ncbi:MAG: hypothetical protein NTU53_24630 [Planctomycetota bacterium]|nr:hypothetical protein [Planctomycetota bacterium]